MYMCMLATCIAYRMGSTTNSNMYNVHVMAILKPSFVALEKLRIWQNIHVREI